MHCYNGVLNFQLVLDGSVSALGMHSRMGFDFSELLVALEMGFHIVLAQCTLHILFLLLLLLPLPCPSLSSLNL